MGANKDIFLFSIANIVALISGVMVAFSFGCATSLRWARTSPETPKQWSDFARANSVGIMCATSWAFVCFLSAFFALWFESDLIWNQFRKSVGVGFWFTSTFLAFFLIFFIMMFGHIVYSANKVHSLMEAAVEKPGRRGGAESISEERSLRSADSVVDKMSRETRLGVTRKRVRSATSILKRPSTDEINH